MDYLFKSKYFFDVSIVLLKNKWLPFVLGVPLFFCLHHYEGIIIDARLYLLQVIHSWFPERFVGDPPFMFGNQDNYGIFTFFYSFILKIFPIDMGAFIFSLFAQSLWLVAAFYFIYHFTKKMQIRLWFMPLILCFIVYSGYKMPNDHSFFFRFAENICVSRSLSMSIGFLGLGMLFTKRKYASLILFLVGTMINPLTAGWGIPLWMFLYYPKTQIPITIIAVALPMTFLLRCGRFDIYPTAWGNCTYDHPIYFLMIWRIAVAIIFFKLFIPKFDKNKFFLKITYSASVVLLLGFYWLITGGLAKHILIYQVQVWRVEWLFFILAMPTFLYIVYKQIWLFRHKRFTQLTTRHISLLLMGFVMFMPAPCSGALAVALILLLVPEKHWNLSFSMFILVSLCIISACEQELMKNFLWGVFEFRFFTPIDMYRDMCCDINNLLFLQLIWIIGIIVSCLYRIIKENKDKVLLYCVIFFLLVYIFFPQFQLLPATLFGFILFYKRQINFILFFLILLLGIGDCLFDTELRESNILVGFPRRILGTLFYVMPIVIGMLAYFLKPLRGGGVF